jgi:hypothetical protein
VFDTSRAGGPAGRHGSEAGPGPGSHRLYAAAAGALAGVRVKSEPGLEDERIWSDEDEGRGLGARLLGAGAVYALRPVRCCG